MSEQDPVLGLLDDLVRLANQHGARIEVQADGFAASVTPNGAPPHAAAQQHGNESGDAASTAPKVQRIHATTVGIFNSEKTWTVGDDVKRGDVLGGVQSLGHIADVKAPADGRIHEVLISTGAPVEYGQALFVIAVA